jgi:hypothetical protein
VLLYTAVFLLILSPALTGLLEPTWDARNYYFPAFTYIADSYKELRFPLWDPYSNGGIPFHAEPGAPVLSPLAILVGVLVPNPFPAFMAYWLILWWWGGLGMLLCARLFRCSSAGAAGAALLYAFSGFFVGHAEHTVFICTASWFPWIFLTAELSMRRRNAGYALLSSLALGLSSLGGYPVLVFFTGFALFVWLLVMHTKRDTLPRVLCHLCIIGAGAVIIWSPTLVSFLVSGGEFTNRTHPLSPADANYWRAFTVPSFFSVISPFSNISARQALGTDVSMANGYTGIFTVPLCLLCFLRYRHTWTARKVIIVFVFFFLIPLGGVVGVRTILYYVLPPLRFMHYNSPFRYVWIFMLCLVGGMGISLLERRPDMLKSGKKLFLIWQVLAALTCILLVWFLQAKNLFRPVHLLPLCLPTILLLPVSVGWACRPRIPWRWSVGVVPAGLLALIIVDSGLHVLTNIQTVFRPRHLTAAEYVNHRQSTVLLRGPEGRIPQCNPRKFNKQYLSKEFVVCSYTQLKTPGYHSLTFESAFRGVMQLPDFYWLSPGVETCGAPEEVRSVLAATGAGDRIPVFVEGHAGLPAGRVEFGSFGDVTVQEYSPEYVRLVVTVPQREGAFLASTERFAAGWKAFVDGAVQEVHRNNLYFRGIYVPDGTHVVEWRYRPPYWSPLVCVSGLYMLFVIVVGVVLVRRATPRQQRRPVAERS